MHSDPVACTNVKETLKADICSMHKTYMHGLAKIEQKEQQETGTFITLII
jgi:hypothetical protein